MQNENDCKQAFTSKVSEKKIKFSFNSSKNNHHCIREINEWFVCCLLLFVISNKTFGDDETIHSIILYSSLSHIRGYHMSLWVFNNHCLLQTKEIGSHQNLYEERNLRTSPKIRHFRYTCMQLIFFVRFRSYVCVLISDDVGLMVKQHKQTKIANVNGASNCYYEKAASTVRHRICQFDEQ